MEFRRIARRILPSGETASVYPFHLSTKGQEDKILFRDDEDLRVAHNYIPICAKKANVIVFADCELETHIHVGLLAKSYDDAQAFGFCYKSVCGQYLHRKYGFVHALDDIESKPIYLEDNAHVRNTVCYIHRNALDTGSRIDLYPWSSYSAIFGKEKAVENMRAVSSLTIRECKAILRTGENLKNVGWMLDDDNILVPSSYCDFSYAEEAFKGDYSFYLRVLGRCDSAQVEQEMIVDPYRKLSLQELLHEVESICLKRYACGPSRLTMAQKIPLIKTIYHSRSCTAANLARCFEVTKEQVELAVERKVTK